METNLQLIETIKGNIEKARIALDYFNDYLKKAVDQNGKFRYKYLYDSSQPSKDQYNILRHAGTIYAMCELYEYNKDMELLSKVRMAIDYLFSQIEILSDNTLVLRDGKFIKLGANALAILALCKAMQLAKISCFGTPVEGLAHWILFRQKVTGEFYPHKQNYYSGKVYDFVSEYYPGETMYALMLLYKSSGQTIYLKTVKSAANYQYLNYSPDVHDHWFLYAIKELQTVEYNHNLHICALSIANSILKSQRPNGSFNYDIRSTPTSTRLEALCSVYWINKTNPYMLPIEPLLIGMNAAMDFILKCLVTPEIAERNKWPIQSVGGILISPYEKGIRIDFVQHATSALLGAISVLTDYLKIIKG